MTEKAYYTYVLHCADDTLYCGYTDDVDRRLATHNEGNGAKYTKARRPVELVYSLDFPDKKLAMKCEWWFKHKLTKARKLDLIKKKALREAFEDYMEGRK